MRWHQLGTCHLRGERRRACSREGFARSWRVRVLGRAQASPRRLGVGVGGLLSFCSCGRRTCMCVWTRVCTPVCVCARAPVQVFWSLPPPLPPPRLRQRWGTKPSCSSPMESPLPHSRWGGPCPDSPPLSQICSRPAATRHHAVKKCHARGRDLGVPVPEPAGPSLGAALTLALGRDFFIFF